MAWRLIQGWLETDTTRRSAHGSGRVSQISAPNLEGTSQSSALLLLPDEILTQIIGRYCASQYPAKLVSPNSNGSTRETYGCVKLISQVCRRFRSLVLPRMYFVTRPKEELLKPFLEHVRTYPELAEMIEVLSLNMAYFPRDSGLKAIFSSDRMRRLQWTSLEALRNIQVLELLGMAAKEVLDGAVHLSQPFTSLRTCIISLGRLSHGRSPVLYSRYLAHVWASPKLESLAIHEATIAQSSPSRATHLHNSAVGRLELQHCILVGDPIGQILAQRPIVSLVVYNTELSGLVGACISAASDLTGLVYIPRSRQTYYTRGCAHILPRIDLSAFIHINWMHVSGNELSDIQWAEGSSACVIAFPPNLEYLRILLFAEMCFQARATELLIQLLRQRQICLPRLMDLDIQFIAADIFYSDGFIDDSWSGTALRRGASALLEPVDGLPEMADLCKQLGIHYRGTVTKSVGLTRLHDLSLRLQPGWVGWTPPDPRTTVPSELYVGRLMDANLDNDWQNPVERLLQA